jgi:hypothetical protein
VARVLAQAGSALIAPRVARARRSANPRRTPLGLPTSRVPAERRDHPERPRIGRLPRRRAVDHHPDLHRLVALPDLLDVVQPSLLPLPRLDRAHHPRDHLVADATVDRRVPAPERTRPSGGGPSLAEDDDQAVRVGDGEVAAERGVRPLVPRGVVRRYGAGHGGRGDSGRRQRDVGSGDEGEQESLHGRHGRRPAPAGSIDVRPPA